MRTFKPLAASRPSSSQAAFERRATAGAVNAAVPVGANSAPTRDLENRAHRGFPQRQRPSLFLWQEERRHPALLMFLSTSAHRARIFCNSAANRLVS